MPERLIAAYILIALMLAAGAIGLWFVFRYSRTYSRVVRWWRHRSAK